MIIFTLSRCVMWQWPGSRRRVPFFPCFEAKNTDSMLVSPSVVNCSVIRPSPALWSSIWRVILASMAPAVPSNLGTFRFCSPSVVRRPAAQLCSTLRPCTLDAGLVSHMLAFPSMLLLPGVWYCPSAQTRTFPPSTAAAAAMARRQAPSPTFCAASSIKCVPGDELGTFIPRKLRKTSAILLCSAPCAQHPTCKSVPNSPR